MCEITALFMYQLSDIDVLFLLRVCPYFVIILLYDINTSATVCNLYFAYKQRYKTDTRRMKKWKRRNI